jgi:hypothetical protein
VYGFLLLISSLTVLVLMSVGTRCADVPHPFKCSGTASFEDAYTPPGPPPSLCTASSAAIADSVLYGIIARVRVWNHFLILKSFFV